QNKLPAVDRKAIEGFLAVCKEKITETGEEQPKEDTERSKKPFITSYNAKLKCASDAVRMEYSTEKNVGRYLVANRDITAGEVLVEEECYAAALLREHEPFRCHHCLTRCLALLPYVVRLHPSCTDVLLAVQSAPP